MTAIHFLLRLYEKEVIGYELAFAKVKILERVGRYHPDIIRDVLRKIGEGREDKMAVLSLRLSKKEVEKIEEIARKENKKKGEVARSLLSYGWIFLNLKRYKEGKISLETLAKELELSVSETIDLLAEYGVTSPISYDDYLEGLETLKQLS
ncbi:hypothetical protein HRbin37_02117 [bacterium HR37]|nr:hypothetical protein HRbin37_02117 [bacterium HR37]